MLVQSKMIFFLNNESYTTDMKETAVLNAIMAAGVTHSVTRGCSSGELPHCSCNHLGHIPPGPRDEFVTNVPLKEPCKIFF